jgi:hypothetical protein
MQETTSPPSLSLADSNSDRPPAVPVNSSTRPRSSKSTSLAKPKSVAWFLQPAFVGLVLVVVTLTVGWGAYTVVVRQTPETDDSELADLEGFDLETPSLGQAEPNEESDEDRSAPSLGNSQSLQSTSALAVELAPQLPTLPPTSSLELPPASSLPSFESARYERGSSGRDAKTGSSSNSGAWLSGTIEAADEAASRIALPSRISQAVGDGPALR